jgi:CRP/FNR family cyclic AMP-dependent transcriptional regulator
MPGLKELLRRLPLFKGLEQEDLDLLAELFHLETYPRNALIFNQGDPADRLFVLLKGRVEIRFKPYDGEAWTVTTIEKGGIFGWSAALGRKSYTSCAICTGECETLHVEGALLRKLIDEHPKTGVVLLDRLAAVIAERLRNTHAHVIGLLQEGMASQTER